MVFQFKKNKALLQAIGAVGVSSVAERLGVGYHVVYYWKSCGHLPFRDNRMLYAKEISKLCREQGHKVKTKELLEY